MDIIIAVYFFGGVLTFYALVLTLFDFSRSALLALIWPATLIGLLVVALVRAFVALWEVLADLWP